MYKVCFYLLTHVCLGWARACAALIHTLTAKLWLTQAANKYKNKAEADEERAAVQMQSLYRGFRDRKQVTVMKTWIVKM